MEGNAVVTTRAAIGGLLELLASALLSGIGVALAMSLAILALCATAQAAPVDDPDTEPWSVAPTPAREAQATRVGALWARAEIASPMGEATRVPGKRMQRPQADPAATVHFLLGLIALMATGMVAVIGRFAESGE